MKTTAQYYNCLEFYFKDDNNNNNNNYYYYYSVYYLKIEILILCFESTHQMELFRVMRLPELSLSS